MSVVDDILKVTVAKKGDQTALLRLIADELIKDNKTNFPTSEILDIMFSATNFQTAPIPGGESQACSYLISLIVQYMTLRAEMLTSKDNTSSNMPMILKALTAQAARLYSEVNANLPLGQQA
jgi:hypothetical protein